MAILGFMDRKRTGLLIARTALTAILMLAAYFWFGFDLAYGIAFVALLLCVDFWAWHHKPQI
jgi:hypothetical protein